MSREDALQKELSRVRGQNRQLKELLKSFTLADKVQKVLDGDISSSQEFDEYGFRVDGDRSSRYAFDASYSITECLESMTAGDRSDTQNIEGMLKRYSSEAVLEACLEYDLRGFELAD
jgi:hypothetical protein